jgi:hypothetical protein
LPGLSEETLGALLHRLFDLIESDGHRGLVIGAVAVSTMSVERFTTDIDATVSVDNDSLERFFTSARAAGFVPRVSNFVEFAKQSRMILLADSETGTGVDLSMAATPFEEEAIDRARYVTYGDWEIPVATAEDLIVWKMIASREKDIEDVRNLVDMNRDLDLRRVRHWLREFDAVLDNPGLPAHFERIRKQVLARDA